MSKHKIRQQPQVLRDEEGVEFVRKDNKSI
ncbi:MAG: hypothetical protein JSV09_09160 [Thermoplasmata archaeon]|nr:MAG: hypothetical protein JSV09_09160 [Thermoplasmata archaeon]